MFQLKDSFILRNKEQKHSRGEKTPSKRCSTMVNKELQIQPIDVKNKMPTNIKLNEECTSNWNPDSDAAKQDSESKPLEECEA